MKTEDPGGGGGGGGSQQGGQQQQQQQQQPVTDWRAGLTGEYEPLKTDKTLESIKGKDFTEAGPILAKNYVETKKLVGNSVQIPGKDAKPEQIAAFREKLGVPKDVSGYAEVKLATIEGLPPVSEEMINSFAKPAFVKIGLTPQQAQETLNLFGEYMARQKRDAADVYIKGQEVLENNWGLNFDANVGLAQRALRKYASEGLLQLLGETQLDMHPDMIDMMYKIGSQVAEDGLIEGSEVTAPNTEAIDAEITAIRGEMLKVNGGTPKFRELENRLELLYKTKYGTKEVGPTMERPK
jgi:hypothetical protein